VLASQRKEAITAISKILPSWIDQAEPENRNDFIQKVLRSRNKTAIETITARIPEWVG
jgi:hypothetical protein